MIDSVDKIKKTNIFFFCTVPPMVANNVVKARLAHFATVADHVMFHREYRRLSKRTESFLRATVRMVRLTYIKE